MHRARGGSVRARRNAAFIPMAPLLRGRVGILWLAATVAAATPPTLAAPSLLFVAETGNDILTAASKGALPIKQFLNVSAALAAAAPNDGLLVMAEAMLPSNPGVAQNGTGTELTAAEWASVKEKNLSVYLEFPATLPGGDGTPLPTAQTIFERVVVASTAGLGPGVGHLALLHPHKLVDYAVLPAGLLPQADLALAKVAGYDTASFGLPPANQTHPFLTKSSPKLLLAATQLSYCRRRRFAPSDRWMAVRLFTSSLPNVHPAV